MRPALAALWLAAGAAQAQTLTIEQAVETAQRQSFAVQIARSALAKAEGEQKTARGAFGPTVSLQGSYVRNEFTGLDSPSGGFFRSESKDVGVTVVQPVDLSGASRAALRSAAARASAARAAYEAEVSRARDQARQAYLDVLLARSQAEVREEALAAADKRLKDAQRRFAEGLVSRFDVLRLETDRKRAEEAVIQAQGNLATAKQALNNVLARPVDTEFEPEEVEEMPPPQGSDDGLVAAAVAQRAEVRQAEATAVALEQVAETEKRGLRPSLGVSASHNRSLGAGAGAPTATTTGAVQLTWPIFDSGVTRGRVGAAEEEARQARFRAEQTLLAVGLEVLSAATRYRTAVDAYATAVAARALAQEALRLAEVSYANQAGTLLDVTTSQAELTAAKGAAASARFAAWKAYSQLLRALGDGVPQEGRQ